MPDTFTPDQFSQTQAVPPVSGATPCAKSRGPAKQAASKARRPLAAPSLDGADVVEKLWQAMKAAQTIVDTEGDVDDGPKLKAYHAAADRFLEEPVTSLLGVQRKLEHVCEHEDVKAHGSFLGSIVLSLLRDLQQVTSQQKPIAKTGPSGASSNPLRTLEFTLSEASSEIEYRAGTINTGVKLAGSLLEDVCNLGRHPGNQKCNPGFIELINQMHFTLDAIDERVTHIVAASDKIYQASRAIADAGTPCSNS